MIKIQTGMVFHLMCLSCTPPKPKFFVLVADHPKPLFFLINSKLSSLQAKQVRLQQSIVTVPVATHSFLKYDSLLDCTTVLGGYSLSDLETQFEKDPAVLMGSLDQPTTELVREAVKASPTLTAIEISWISKAL